MEWFAWFKELLAAIGINDPKVIAPAFATALGTYLLLQARIRVVEERLTKAEQALAAVTRCQSAVERMEERLDDFFRLVQIALGVRATPQTPTEALMEREMQKSRRGGG